MTDDIAQQQQPEPGAIMRWWLARTPTFRRVVKVVLETLAAIALLATIVFCWLFVFVLVLACWSFVGLLNLGARKVMH